VHQRRRKQLGSEELEMIKALAAAKAAGIDIPANAMWLLERNFDPRVLKGTTECPKGHENSAGSHFCSSCGSSMSGSVPTAEITAAETASEILPDTESLLKLPLIELRKMCRIRGLPEYGAKPQIAKRLLAS
jgi:hypothetical protein